MKLTYWWSKIRSVNNTGSDEPDGRATVRSLFAREHGAQLVEFAIVLPVILVLLMGIVTGGMAYNRSIGVDNAARESARYGATLPVESGMSTWLNDVADIAIGAATGALDDGEPGRLVCVAYVHPDGSTADDQTTRVVVDTAGNRVETVGTDCFADARPNDERRVQVQLKRTSDLILVFWSRTLQLTGESTVRFERES
jgi:hypothetical protein